jgi:hypothetical protein
MTTVVYVGMSIRHEDAQRILRARYLPPVRRGDLPGLGKDVRQVGIVDGVFLSEASVGHREIMALLQRGVTVVGGGSMGALRAAELEDLGMIGVGRIFEMYRDGTIEGDDEVALVFDPETYRPLSEPLVNIRYFLSEAVRRGIMEVGDEESLIVEMRKVFYPRRSFPELLGKADGLLDEASSASLRELHQLESFDLKRKDSLEVLNTLKRLQKLS